MNWKKKALSAMLGEGVTHEIMAKKIQVTSKKWVDRGGGRGHGHVTRKVTKYACNGSNVRNVNNINVGRNNPNIQNLEMLVSNTHNYGISVGLDNDVGSLAGDVSVLESESKEMA